LSWSGVRGAESNEGFGFPEALSRKGLGGFGGNDAKGLFAGGWTEALKDVLKKLLLVLGAGADIFAKGLKGACECPIEAKARLKKIVSSTYRH
jgi:hypothetical protein